MVAFPEDYKLLVPRLLIETMGAISASFVTRIDTSTDEAASISRASVGGTVFFSPIHGKLVILFNFVRDVLLPLDGHFVILLVIYLDVHITGQCLPLASQMKYLAKLV